MSGLLVATYVEPLAAGQVGDGSAFGVGVMVVASTDCVTVTCTPLATVLVVGASLDGETE